MTTKNNRYLPEWRRHLKMAPKVKHRSAFEVETMEPRLLLNAALYDTTPTTPDAAVQTRISTQLLELFDQLSELGFDLNANDALNEQLKEIIAPLLGQSLDDLQEVEMGDFFEFARDAALKTYLEGTSPDSAGLALEIDTAIDSIAGLSADVTDESTATQLDILIEIDTSGSSQEALKLGDAGQEFNLDLDDDALVTLERKESFSFRIQADLSDTSAAGLGDSKFQVELGELDVLSAEVLHTSTTNPVDGWGIDVGLLGAGEDGVTSGAYVSASDIKMNITGKLDLSAGAGGDGIFSLDEMKAFGGNFDTAFSFDLPTTASTPTVIGQNTAHMSLSVDVYNDAASDEHIASLDGVTGILGFRDDNLFDDRAPLVTADDTMTAFSRLTASDMLEMVNSTVSLIEAMGVTGELKDLVPLLNLSTGDAYAFGEAFRTVMMGQLQNEEIVLTAVNAPSTRKDNGGTLESDPLDFTGAAGFNILVGTGTFYAVSLSTDPARLTLEDLRDDLNAALDAALPAGHGVAARLSEGDSPRLELFADSSTPFLLAGFAPDMDGLLDLGFNTHAEVVLSGDGPLGQPSGTTEDAERFQLPGILFESSGTLDMADFTQSRQFNVRINDGNAVTVTLAGRSYADIYSLTTTIRNQLIAEGLYDSVEETGVNVRVIGDTGSELLQFYGESDVYKLQLSGSHLSSLGLSTATQTAPYLDFEINGDGDTYRVYLPGNMTNGVLDVVPNFTISDLVQDIRFALAENTYQQLGGGVENKVSLLNESGGSGIDVRGTTDAAGDLDGGLQFFARNPGLGTDEVASFEITGQSASLAHFNFDSGYRESTSYVSGEIFTEAAFNSVQEFAAILADAPTTPLVGITTPSPSFNTGNLTFTFPIEFTYTPADLTDVELNLSDRYDKISNLQTDSTVTVSRSSTSSFEFEVALKPDTSTSEPLTVELPVTLMDWDGVLSTDAVIRFIFDDGVEHDLRINEVDTLSNASTQDFADLVALAIAADADLAGKIIVSVEKDAVNDIESIFFTTDPLMVDTRMLQMVIPPEINSPVTSTNAAVDVLNFATGATAFTSVAGTLHATGAPTGFNTSNYALISFELPDGSIDTIVLEPEETADNTQLDYPGGDGGVDPIGSYPEALVRDLNFAIQQSLELTTLYDAKVEAFVDGDGYLAFRLNPDLFPDDGSLVNEDWTVTVQADYTEAQYNGLNLDFGSKEKTVAGATTDIRLTAVSGSFGDVNPYKLDSGASFDISINGSDYVRLTVPANTGIPTQADLISAFNTALAGTTVTIGASNYVLSDFLKAVTYGDGSRISLISLDNTASANPEVRSFRLLPADVAGNEAVSVLGFSADEQLTGARGGESFIDALQLTGTATVDGVSDVITATGGFGFAEWEAAGGNLDLLVSSRTSLVEGLNTRFRLMDLMDIVSEGTIADISSTAVDPSTYATLTLDTLTFTDDSQGVAMSGLLFGANPTITISHSLTGDSLNSSINDFAALPDPDVTYTETNGMENLYKLGFEDVLEGLQRTADFVTDQMRIDPDGAGAGVNAYSTKLLFVREGMQEIFDLGAALDETIAELNDARPRTLQEVRRSIADLLQLNFSEVDVSLETSFLGGLLDSASVVIQFPFMQALSVSLPLFIDLVQLRDRSSDPAIVDYDLAGLSALASSRTNPLEVSVNLLAELNLDIAVQAVKDGVAIQPRTILRDTTEILTHFNMVGENLNGDLPVGNARFRLTNGQVAINAHGEVAADDANGTPGLYNNDALTEGYVAPVPVTVEAATTEELTATFSAGSLTADTNGLLSIDGFSGFSIGDLVLINHQSDTEQNGVYRVTQVGSASQTWQLVRAAEGDSAAELNATVFEAQQGEDYAGRQFVVTEPVGTLNTDPVRFARLIDPAVFEINLNGDQILAYSVLAATTSQLDANYVETGDPTKPKAYRAELVSKSNGSINAISTTLASGRQVVGIDGVGYLDINDYVLIKDQLDDVSLGNSDIRYQNGIYRVAELGDADTPWRLVRVDWVDEISEFDELRVKVTSGRDNIGDTFIQQTTTLGVEVAAGENFDFSSELERVYANFNSSTLGFDAWADINPDGQAQALLPMIIVVTDSDGNEVLVTKDTSELTEAQKQDSALVASLPDFVPVNIRVLDEPVSGRTGLDRLFDITVPANDPGIAAPVVFFSNPDVSARKLEFPALGPNIPPVDVLNILRDPFLMGEALDLSLFNLQFAIDQALGNQIALLGGSLPDYVPFIEEWRSTLTNRVRDELRVNKLKPINAILNSLYSVLGQNGINYLADNNGDMLITRADIQVLTLDAAETATVWDPNDAANYDRNGANEEFEITPASAVSLTFDFDLLKTMSDDSTEINIDRIDLGVPELGITFSNETAVVDANGDKVDKTGGVNLRTAFHLNMGFGVDLQDGFFLYNPENTSPTDDNPLMTIDIEAVLDGDLATPGIQVFEQANRSSSWNELNVQMADGMDIPGATDLASGFYGTFDFTFNSGSGGLDNQRITLADMNALATLGVDQFDAPAEADPRLYPRGIMDFNLNADTDIHLLVEGGKAGGTFGNSGIPDIQFEFYYQERFGSGYDLLNYSPMAALQASGNGDPDMPEFRYNRHLIDIVDLAYTGLTIDVQGFLEGSIFEALLKFEEGYSHIRPIVDFLLTPVPGTEWMNEPFILGDLFGGSFVTFASTVNRLSDMVRELGQGVQGPDRQPNWAKPRMNLTVSSNLGRKTSLVKKIRSKLGSDEKYQKYLDDNEFARDVRSLDASDRSDTIQWTDNPLYRDSTVTEEQSKAQLKESFAQKLFTPNKFADRFEKFRDKGFAINQKEGKLKKFVKKQANESLAKTDDRPGSKSPIIGLTGGGFRLDYVKPETIFQILNGETANLTFLELPRLELGVAYRRSFPLPAFPPLIATVGGQFSINVHLKFGWDTQGFYWSTLDTAGQASPAFGLQGRFTVGVALSAGLIEAGIEAFFEIDVDFNWNDVTVDIANVSGTSFFTPVDEDAFPVPPSYGDPGSVDYGKLRQSQMDYLQSQPGAMGNLFDVTITGRVGVTFYVDLTIPIPFVGPITKRILAKTFSMEIFQTTVFALKPSIQLGSVSGGTLQLHIGTHADLRLFGDTRDRNEVFTITSRGAGTGSSENVTVTAVLNNVTFTQNFDNITRIVGTAGGGQSLIDASALTRATVFFTGGSGNTILYSGNGSANGLQNELRGGTGTATLIGSTTQSSILRAGSSNTVIIGGSAGDDIYSGGRSDRLVGGGGGDTYYFGDDFGRDRIEVTGTGNTVDFSAAVDDITFDLGRLVQSAKSGLNTVFFAPDESGQNTIDTWIGGRGDDRFNTFFFAPDRTLNINGGQGENFYAMTIGNPSTRYFADTNPGALLLADKMAPQNFGYISLVDPTGNGHTLIKQTFPERISYDRTFVDNGREQATMSGMKRVDLDAGNTTVVWGQEGVEWIDLGIGAEITAGTIEMISSVEAEGLTLNLKRSFSITQRINLRNDSDIVINIQNPDPLGDSSLFMGPAPGHTASWEPGIYSSSGSVTDLGGTLNDSTIGDGEGKITINTPTGSVFNSDPSRTGVIQALNGEVVIQTRNTIGLSGDPIKINAKYLAGKTSTSAATLSQGIFLTSDTNLHIAEIDGVDGLITQSGRIEIDMDPGLLLQYANISAGDGRDVVLSSDRIEISSGKQVTIQVLETFTNYRTESYTYWTQVAISVPYAYSLWGGAYFYTYWIDVPVTETYQVAYTDYRYVDQQILVGAGGQIQTEGNVYIRNASDLMDIEIGKATTSAGVLSVTRGLLDTIASTAAAIVVGRNSTEAIKSGKATVYNYAFDQGLVVHGSEVDIPGTGLGGNLSSQAKLEFHTYDSVGGGDGSIVFDANADLESLSITARAFRDIIVNGYLQVTTDSGLLDFAAGVGASTTGGANNSGNLTVNAGAVVEANVNNATVNLAAGNLAGDILIDADITSLGSMAVNALGGSITVDSTKRLTADRLAASAKNGSTLYTDVRQLDSSTALGSGLGSGADLVVNELDGLDIRFMQTDAGDIDLNVGGNLTLGRIDASGAHDVRMNVNGSVEGDDPAPAPPVLPDSVFNVRAADLQIDSLGGIELITDIAVLDARTSGPGALLINNDGGQLSPLRIDEAVTADGRISIDTEGDLDARLVRSNTSAAANSISLTTRQLFGGDILVDVVDAGALGDVTLDAGDFTLGGAITSGGTIKSDAGTAGRVIANSLIAWARGFAADPDNLTIDLRTSVAELIARTFTGGDPAGGAASRADIRIDELDAIRLVDIQTADGDFSVVAGDSITHDDVQTPGRDQSLTATVGDILHDNGKLFGRDLVAVAQGQLTLNTTMDSLDVRSSVLGDITITESDSVLLKQVTTEDGNIEITAGEFDGGTGLITKGGNVEVGVIRAGAAGTQDVKLTAAGRIEMADLLLFPLAKVRADLFTAISYGRMDLLTGISRFVGASNVLGNISVLEEDEVTIESLTAENGSIDFTSGGTMTAELVRVLTDIAQASTFDIDLHATAGDIIVDLIDAGLLHNDLSITSDAGGIYEVADNDADVDLIADVATLTAANGIGSLRGLETSFNELIAGSSVAGNIDFNESDGILLTSVTTNSGDIIMDTATGDTLVNLIRAGAGRGNDLFINAFGGSLLESGADAAADLQARKVTLNIHGAIQQQSGGYLETWIEDLIAHTTAAGEIELDEVDALILQDVDTFDGFMDIRTGAQLTASDVQSLTDSDANDITFRTTTGDIL
ncbi:LEPR-XLL domain-containing protein, partial [Kiritimatiellaeota bacterium B1221]|nr:LEPR-XLL domain-containing protein [Kiritimatiellaeota bacterium B1221]